MTRIPFSPFGVSLMLWISLASFSVDAQQESAPVPNAQAPAEPLSIHTFLQPYRSIEMSAIESGVISEILVEEGDLVTEGQELLKLDTEVVEARLAVAKAQAESEGRIIAAASEHKADSERYDKLKALKSRPSNFELIQAQASMESSGGRHTEAIEQQNILKLQVPQIEAELNRRILRSPVAGVIVEITKDVAEPVALAENQRGEHLIQIAVVNQLRAIAHIPADAGRNLQKGESLSLKVDQGSSQPERQATGTIEFVSPVIDSASNTIRVRLVVDNSDRQIRAGSSAQLIVPR